MIRAIQIIICCLSSATLFSQIYTEPLKKRIDSLLLNINEESPGGHIHIEQGSQLIYSRSFGVSELENKTPFTDFTLMNIGGISKTFISYAILKLHEQGKLNIEDSIYKYIPDFKKKEFAQKIRIRDLMMHTSGLKDLPISPIDSVFSLTMNDQQNFELVKYSNTLAFEPGSGFTYSDEAFSALVLILEKVSKTTWQDYIQKNIAAPIGMTYTKFTSTTEVTGVAHAYKKQNNTFVEYDQNECPKMYTASNGGIYTNIVDLRKYIYGLKYCLFVSCDNVTLTEKVIKPKTWYSIDPPPHNYCWFIKEEKGKDTYIESIGASGGYRSHILFFPQKDLTIIYVSNNSQDMTADILNELKKFKYFK